MDEDDESSDDEMEAEPQGLAKGKARQVKHDIMAKGVVVGAAGGVGGGSRSNRGKGGIPSSRDMCDFATRGARRSLWGFRVYSQRCDRLQKERQCADDTR